MRPLHDDLVGLGEPLGGGEDRAGVAHGDVVAEEGTHPGDGGGEVDGAEDDHPGSRRERVHEDRDIVAAALAVRAVVQGRRRAVGQQAAGVVAHGVVQAGRPERARHRVGPDDEAPAASSDALDDGGHGDRPAGPDVGDHRVQVGERLTADGSTKMSMMPPQVSPTAKASSSLTPYRCTTGGAPSRISVASSYTAPSTQPPDTLPTDRAVGSDDHRGPGLPRRRAPGADDGGHADRAALGPPPHQLVERRHAPAITPASSSSAARLCPATSWST